jgi:hypothetical protein
METNLGVLTFLSADVFLILVPGLFAFAVAVVLKNRCGLPIKPGPAKKTGVTTPSNLAVDTDVDRILCRKCGHANQAGHETCAICGHAMFVVCQCGAHTLRSLEKCGACGHSLRRRRFDPDLLFTSPAGWERFHPVRTSPGPNDLGVALLMFGLVAFLFGLALLIPKFESFQNERYERQQERIEDYQHLRRQ